MISLPQGFKVGAAEAVDSRLTLSKAEMLTIKDSLMPAVYLAVCKDDNAIYIYNKDNSVDPETGKFRVYISGSSGEIPSSSKLEWGTLGDNK